jgi:probable F420-dependent oxidoreductase
LAARIRERSFGVAGGLAVPGGVVGLGVAGVARPIVGAARVLAGVALVAVLVVRPALNAPGTPSRAAKAVGVNLGRVGIWMPKRFGAGAVAEVEALGYGTLWLGGSPSVQEAVPFLEASGTITIATGILNVWQHEPADVAAAQAETRGAFPGRFLLGVGIGHPEATSDYTRPLATMRAFCDGLASAPQPVPRDELVLAALRPRMLDLAKELALGTHTYFVPPEHTRFARERLGPDALVAPEVAVVLEADPEAARAIARRYARLYLGLTNYTKNLRQFGFNETDIADGGSDRLIDAVIPHGTPEQIAAALDEHFAAGASHVCLQPLGHGEPPVENYRALARVLTGSAA